MNMQEVRAAARERLKGWCRVCPVCDGRACAGEVPGMGGAGTGEAFKENVRALNAWKLRLKTLHEEAAPDTAVTLFGQRLALPVMGAPMAGAAFNLGGAMAEDELADCLHAGCAAAGTLSWSGDGVDPSLFSTGLAAVQKQGRGIPTVKPRGLEEIINRARLAEEAGASALAVDVDTAGFINMAARGQPVGPTPPDEVAALVKATRLPVILKGIMTPEEAELAASLGVAGIVVSNHGGRVLDACQGTAEVLPAIASAVRGRLAVLLDGGVRSGADVLKALALGASAVLVGRPLITAAAGGGAEGVSLYINSLREGLLAAMMLTGTSAAVSVSPDIVTCSRR